MPTYVYQCDDCKHQFELFQRMADDPIDTCPNCQSRVRRVIHPVGVVFKGSGWYINDSRAGNGQSSTESSPPESKETVKAGEKTSETKPDAKSKQSESSDGSKSRPTEKAAS